ncbi:hypothetical protein [Halopseudomonas salegens]|uniref:Uncharacterized protein n=1 Tax=Halopseudomonas salegens TaxID=1434072 RepID=A0A1H2G049_9GAMM|nr:hypothetical protein [Halopseudomonas salegens]SDU12953.1 hypothetical protein SAMN05216210_1934 [Halopseudomonas salegens]
MPALQSAWIFYLNHPAFVINALALFYGLCGAWLVFATQYRSRRAIANLTVSPANSAGSPPLMELDPASQRTNRLFYTVAAVCLGLAMLLTLISTLI